MRTLRSWLGLLGTLALACLPVSVGAQPVGSEFQVNTYTTGSQRTGRHSVAADSNGKFVVVWKHPTTGVFGQRFDSAGAALGTEFRVSTNTFGLDLPSVAAAADGDFVVVWEGRGLGDVSGIFGQRFDSAGEALGNEFRVNTYTPYLQAAPSIASDASGNFVVVWQCHLLYSGCGTLGQRYDSEGVPQGGEFRVGSSDDNTWASVASDASGNFVVVWSGSGQGDTGGAYGQRYDRTGGAVGAEFRVNTYTASVGHVATACDAGGNFVVVWESVGQDGSGLGIFGRRYDSDGSAFGSEFRVNSFTLADQEFPFVASDASGNFVVTWRSDAQDGSSFGVFGQRYSSGGVAQGAEFQINSFTPGSQAYASGFATGTDQFVVAWQSAGQDGNGYGVFGKRYDFGADTIMVVSPNTNVKWRIGSQQRIQWAHNLGSDASFRIELDRDDDGDFEELIAAAEPVDSATKGSFAWTVTGPRSGTARVRVSWTDDPAVSDASDVTFQIRPVGLD